MGIWICVITSSLIDYSDKNSRNSSLLNFSSTYIIYMYLLSGKRLILDCSNEGLILSFIRDVTVNFSAGRMQAVV